MWVIWTFETPVGDGFGVDITQLTDNIMRSDTKMALRYFVFIFDFF